MKKFRNIDRLKTMAQPAISNLFGKLSKKQFEKISSLLQYVHFLSDEYIFEEGDAGDALYILCYGRVRVLREEGDTQVTIAELAKGECIGEMALITGNPRNASVIAIRDCDMVKMSKEAFNEISLAHPELGLNLARLIISRFTKKTVHHKSKGIVNLTLMPLQKSVDIMDFAMKLFAELDKSRKTILIDERRVNELLGKDLANTQREQSEDNSELTKFLNDLEDQYELVIYLSKGELNNWSKRCTRQADEILLIGDINADPKLTPQEDVLFKEQPEYFSARQTLVLLHEPNQGMVKATKQWLLNRSKVGFHMHMELNDQEDLGRLKRYLLDESIGLVLAGGGIKAMAHAGAYKALCEYNIPVDLVGGTSMGAVFAAGIGYKWGVEEMLHNVIRFRDSKPSSDYNMIPYISFLKGNQMGEMLSTLFSEYDIEDCMKNMYCISANLSLSKEVIHDSGNVAHALQASMSLPGIWPPKISDKGFLVDGGVVNNFPVDVMNSYSVKTVIGINFSSTPRSEISFDSYPSGGQMLLNRMSKKKKYKGVPTLFSTLMKSSLLASTSRAKESIDLCDIYIQPNTQKIGLMDFKKIEAAVEAGYEETIKVLEENDGLEGLVSKQES